MKKLAMCLILGMGLGCGGGSWQDGGLLVGQVICDPGLAKDKEAQEALFKLARLECGKNGKAFTGDYRCEKGGGQIKCK
jgi:hypothetical protein